MSCRQERENRAIGKLTLHSLVLVSWEEEEGAYRIYLLIAAGYLPHPPSHPGNQGENKHKKVSSHLLSRKEKLSSLLHQGEEYAIDQPSFYSISTDQGSSSSNQSNQL